MHLQRLRSTYAELRVRTLGNDLTRAVEAGNLRTVQRILSSMSRDEQVALAGDPDKAQAIEEARRALNILKLAQTAERNGAWVDLLQQSTALRALMPKADVAAELREKAAKGLEAEAATAIQAGNYQQALDRLGALAKVWPDRPGLGARIDRIKSDQEADQKVTAVLAQAQESERQKRPESGLAMLQALRPPRSPRGPGRGAAPTPAGPAPATGRPAAEGRAAARRQARVRKGQDWRASPWSSRMTTASSPQSSSPASREAESTSR